MFTRVTDELAKKQIRITAMLHDLANTTREKDGELDGFFSNIIAATRKRKAAVLDHYVQCDEVLTEFTTALRDSNVMMRNQIIEGLDEIIAMCTAARSIDDPVQKPDPETGPDPEGDDTQDDDNSGLANTGPGEVDMDNEGDEGDGSEDFTEPERKVA